MAVIQEGSRVFVTGVSGLIGSHVTDHLLCAGYLVRGAVQNEKEAQMMHEIYGRRHAQATNTFETVIVVDMKVPGAFEGLLNDCEGVAHVASDLSFNPDPNRTYTDFVPPLFTDVITGCVNAINSILQVAQSTPSIKRFVYCSSSNAATRPLSDQPRHVNATSWNEEILEQAWAPPPYEADRAYAVYAASKVSCERAAWKFMQEQKPNFDFNTVLPNYTTGVLLQPLSIPGAGSTARWVRDVFDRPFEEAFVTKLRDQDPQWQVDVEDIAKLHVAALTLPDVKGERLLGFSHRFNYNSFLRVFRELAPERTFPQDDPGQREASTSLDCARSIEILQKYGNSGWISFAESVRRSCLGTQ